MVKSSQEVVQFPGSKWLRVYDSETGIYFNPLTNCVSINVPSELSAQLGHHATQVLLSRAGVTLKPPVVKMHFGDWMILDDTEYLYFYHVPTERFFNPPPSELVAIYQRQRRLGEKEVPPDSVHVQQGLCSGEVEHVGMLELNPAYLGNCPESLEPISVEVLTPCGLHPVVPSRLQEQQKLEQLSLKQRMLINGNRAQPSPMLPQPPQLLLHQPRIETRRPRPMQQKEQQPRHDLHSSLPTWEFECREILHHQLSPAGCQRPDSDPGDFHDNRQCNVFLQRGYYSEDSSLGCHRSSSLSRRHELAS